MGYIRYPAYYADFRCTASDCSDNCCMVGWGIDIDDETLTYYQNVPGTFGEHLKKNIALPKNQEELAQFIPDKQGRCPFLNENHLCDIYTNLGEQHLCQICTDHPRFYDWFLDGKECGVGLCCEAAAEQILKKTDGFPMIEQSDGEPMPNDLDEVEMAELQIANLLFFMRDELFHIIKPEENTSSLDDKIDKLYQSAFEMQDHCYAMFFPDIQVEPNEPTSWSQAFWNAEYLTPLLKFFTSLEINDMKWKETLQCALKKLPEILAHRNDFLTYYSDSLYEYEQLLLYFIYRHFMKAREDGAVLDRVVFALISVEMIQLMDILCWLEHGTLTHKQQIDICKLYSQETEYDEDNTEEVSLYALPC